MKTIFTINCEKSDSIGFIVGKLEKLVINNIWNVRINLKGFGLADMERANRMVDALKIVEDKYQQSFNLFIDIPYPGNKCRIKTDEEVQQVGANEIFELCTLGSEMTGRYRRIQVSKSFLKIFPVRQKIQFILEMARGHLKLYRRYRPICGLYNLKTSLNY